MPISLRAGRRAHVGGEPTRSEEWCLRESPPGYPRLSAIADVLVLPLDIAVDGDKPWNADHDCGIHLH